MKTAGTGDPMKHLHLILWNGWLIAIRTIAVLKIDALQNRDVPRSGVKNLVHIRILLSILALLKR